MHEQYTYVVNQIIEELLVCQYMESKKILLEPGALDAEEKFIRNDYPNEIFEQTLIEEGINLEEWREILRRRLVLKQFLTQVLRPEITITSDEVHQYFTAHSSDFFIPEQWHFILISGLDKKTVENARNSFIVNKNTTAVQKEFLISVHDVRMGKDRLPDDLHKELAPLGVWKGAPVKAAADGFRTVVLIEKIPATMLEASEMAKRVEDALVEEKMRDHYAAWVTRQLSKANIRIAPAFFAEPAPSREAEAEYSLPHNSTSINGRP
jgi:hypothetical protein